MNIHYREYDNELKLALAMNNEHSPRMRLVWYATEMCLQTRIETGECHKV